MAEWDNFTNQKQWEKYLRNLVRTNEKALIKSIMIIYNNQTFEEKEAGTSIYENKIGFNRFDSKEMMRIARKLKQRVPLTESEIAHARIVMPKYWKQLMIISKQKQKDKKEQEEFEEELENERILAQENKELSHELEENIYRCINEGVSCSYYICDECPNYSKKLK